MKFTPEMTLEEFIELTKKYAENQYGVDPADLLMKQAESRKERMEKNKIAGNSYSDFTDVSMEEIQTKIHTVGNIKAGQFLIKIKNYKQDKDGATVNVDIYEEKLNKTHFGENVIARKINILKDIRFETCEWIKYFKNPVMGGFRIPIDTAAEIVRWMQALSALSAFI